MLVLFEYSKEMNRFYSQTFYSTPMKSIKIPQGVTEIQNGAFYESALEVIEFEVNSQLETIGQQVSSFPLRNVWSNLFSPNIVATVVHSHDPNCASFSFSIGVLLLR